MPDAIKEIRVRWIGDANDLDRATQQARRSINEMGRDVQQVGRQNVESMGRTGDSMRSLAGEVGKLAAQYAGLAATAAAFWKGISHNAEIQSLQQGMATIVSANEQITDASGKQIEGAAKLKIAMSQVYDVFGKLKVDAINTTATLPQLAEGFEAALPAMMTMGASLDQARQVTVAMVQAMGAMSIPLDQARQEINSILQGQISEDSQLAKNLGLNNDMVKSWQSQGKLVDNLLDRLKDFTVAGEAAGKTWGGATSTLQDNLGNMLGTVTGASFKTLTEEINKVNSNAFGPEAQENAAIWGRIINDSLTTAMGLAGGVGSVLLRGAKLFQDALGGIQIGAAKLGGIALRSDLIHQAVADLPERGNAAQGGSPEGIFRVGKLLPNFLPENMGSDQIAGILSKAGLRGKELEKFRARLAEIDKMVNAGVEGQTDEILNGWERDLKASLAAAKNAAKGVKVTPRKPAAAPTKPTHGPSASSLIYGFGQRLELGATSLGPLGDLNIGGLGSAPINTSRPWDTPMLSGSLGSLPENKDLIKGQIEAEKALAAWRKQDEKELQEIREGYQKKNAQAEKDMAELRMKLMVDGLNSVSNLIAQSIQSGKAPSGGDYLRLGGSLASTAALAIPGIGIPLSAGISAVGNIGGASLDRQDQNRGVLETVSSGGTVSRNDYISALRDKYKRNGVVGGVLGDLFGTNYIDEEGLNAELGTFDTKNFGRLMAQFEKGPGGDRHRAELDLNDQIAKMTTDKSYTTEQINAFRAAKNAEINATYKAAEALGKIQDASERFSGGMSAFGLKEQLGLGKTSSQDIGKLLSFTAFNRGGDSWDQVYANNASFLSDTDRQKKLIDLYGQMSMFGTGTGLDTWMPQLKELGFTGEEFHGMDTKSVMSLFQSTIIPAIQELTRINGPAATGSISGAGSDSALTLDAPMTRQVINNNSFTVQSQAFMGNQADAMAFAKMIATLIRTAESQAV